MLLPKDEGQGRGECDAGAGEAEYCLLTVASAEKLKCYLKCCNQSGEVQWLEQQRAIAMYQKLVFNFQQTQLAVRWEKRSSLPVLLPLFSFHHYFCCFYVRLARAICRILNTHTNTRQSSTPSINDQMEKKQTQQQKKTSNFGQETFSEFHVSVQLYFCAVFIFIRNFH